MSRFGSMFKLFELGDKCIGKYDESVRVVKGYYPSVSGFKDELLWAALWLYKATDNEAYLSYALDKANEFGGITWSMNEFSWDVKFSVGGGRKAYEPASKLVLEQYGSKALYYLCACLKKSNASNVRRTPGGLLYVRQWNNMQYVSNSSFLLTVYTDHLRASNRRLLCDCGELGPEEVLAFTISQVDYILGANPKATSYLVRYGSRYPQRIHHRGGSIESHGENKGFIGCTQGYDNWFHRKGPNPNVVVGALIGGPNEKDEFSDDRRVSCKPRLAPIIQQALLGFWPNCMA
ncbi:Endoglucanase 11 [Hibiscus syriacus]|uniref:cellulase n=1 Tax=Hibiscus syriacus TaxID=106335 RepID=A0A6A3ALQ3_HIBSY|nr:Endoglucanase 11 [Hibiscus syriacus]